jgi:multimeric flavodoxin WrbA
MSKTAAVILASPRKGSNSGALGRAVAEGVSRAGGRAEIIDLSGLDIKPCLGCGHCQRNGGRCSQRDGMQTVYPALKAASILILATPVYMFNMTGQLKIFLDRCYALMAPETDALTGKAVAAALSYGADSLDSSGGLNVIRSLEDLCRFCQMTWRGFVHGHGRERDALAKNEAALAQARALGETLME